MAKQAILERDRMAKTSYIGFCWTVLFYGTRNFIFSIILSFFYNKYATE